MSKLTSLMKNSANRDAAVKKRRPGQVKCADRKQTGKQTDKRAEGSLKESEEKYRSLFEQAGDAIIISDAKTGIIIDVNKSGTELLGLSREELIGKHQSIINPPEMAEEYKNLSVKHADKKHWVSEDIIIQRPNGTKIPVNVTINAINTSSGQVIQGILRDMTERNFILDKLKESEKKFSMAFHASPEAMSISDLTDGKFIEVNDSYLRVTGYTREELLNQTAADFNMWATPEDRKKMLEPMQRRERLHNVEIDFRIKGGGINTMLVSTEYIQVSGKQCVLVVSTDITEYKRTKKALHESEQQLARVFRLTPQSIIVTRMADGRVIDTNDNFHRITGYTREETIGHTVTDLGLWETQEDRKKMVQTLKSGNCVFSEEHGFVKKSGEILTGLLSAEQIDINGEACLVATITDITRQKQLEKAQKESEEKFSKAFHSLPERITITRISDGMILDINESFLRDSNRTREETVGHTVQELKLWAIPGMRENIIREIQENGHIVNREVTYLTGKGEEETTLYSADIITIGGEPCMISITTNITERKNIEEALAKEALHRRILIEQSTDGIVIIDETGAVFEANRRFTEMIGYTMEETKKLHLWDWEFQSGQEQVVEKLRTVDPSAGCFETQHRRQDGTIYDVEISINAATLAGQKLIFCVCRDITQRKQIENALKESEEKFSKAFRSIPESITISRLKDGVFVEANDNFCRVAGLPREEVIGHTGAEIGLFEPTGWRAEIIKTIQTQGRIFNREMYTDAGKEKGTTTLFSADIINIGGEPCLISTRTDITERKNMEEALKTSEEKFSKAFRSIPESIAISRVSDGVIIDANDNFCRIVGRPYDEIIGHTNNEITPTRLPGSRDEDIKTIKEKGSIKNREIILDANTENMVALLFSADIIDISGEPCVLSTSTDITERKRMEEALAKEALHHRILIEQSNDGIVIIDEDGAVNEANLKFSEMIGYSPEETLKLHVEDWEYLFTHETLVEMLRAVDQSGDHFETKHRRKDGTIYDVEISTNGASFAGQKLIFCVCRDITERKRMEEVMANDAIRRRILLDQSRDGIVIIDQTGAVYEANRRFAEMHGYTLEDALKLHIWDWEKSLPPEKLLENIQLRDEKGANFEAKHSRKDGSIFDVEVSSNGTNYAGQKLVFSVIRDISERKRMEQARSDDAVRRRILIEQSRDGIVIMDQTGAVFEANRKFAEMHGYTPEEIAGLHIWDWEKSLPPEQLLAVIQKRDQQGVIFETRHHRKDGSIINVEVSSNGTVYAGQRLVFSVVRDISERKRMEQALRDSEEKFSAAFHSSPNAICILTTKDGNFIEINESFIQFTGYTRAEIIGHNPDELGLHLNEKEMKQMADKIQEKGNLHNGEFNTRMKSGEIRSGLFSSEIIDIGGEPCFIMVITDITERKRMEQTLRESEEKFSKAFQTIPESVSISRLSDGVFVDVNESFCRHNSLTREEIIGRTAVELGIWAQSEGQDQVIRTLDKQTRLENIEFELKVKNGEVHTVLVSADVFNIGGEPHILTIGNDITDRKQVEVALRDSEEKFSKAFHAIPESVSIATLKDGVFLAANESFLRANQLTREQVIGHSGVELNLWNTPGQHEEMVRAVTERGSIVNEERQFVLESGEAITLLYSASIIQIAGESCIITISNNITERKQTEEQLKKALTELQSSSARLKATNKELESFSYSVSHDLRSPLRSIDGFSQALLEDYAPKLDETARDYLNRIRSASQKMGELIDGLLKLSRVTRNDMHYEAVDLSALAQDITARLQETDPERKAEIIITPGLKAAGDAQMLRVLLENLLGNAWKFTGKVPKARIEFSSSISSNEETFVIKDNGAGFDMAFRDKLFGAFQRLHDSQDFTGTGIGLATVQRIINRHGGTVRAEGKVNQGAAFYFTL